MALLNTAIASPKNFYTGVLATTLATIYTAPAQSANVTSPSATAYIKEITICNSSAVTATVIITLSGSALVYGLSIPPNDTKILSLNTMVNASQIIQASSGTASSIYIIMSGVEVQ